MPSKDQKPKLAPIDTESILRRLSEIRQMLPLDETIPRKQRPDERARGIETSADFDYAAVADAFESMAEELSAVVERKRAKALEDALRVYYTAEELAHDPAHAELIPYVEAMRRAYEQSYGKPIPPKPEG